MNRRNLAQVVASTAVAHVAVSVMGCQAQTSPKLAKEGDAHDHEDHPAPASDASPVSPELSNVAKKTADCVVVGETCLEHCIRSLASGSTMMADCAKQVHQMLAICRSMSNLAAMGSEYSAEMAQICKKACGACAAECKKHAGHHAECKACHDACTETLSALEGLA